MPNYYQTINYFLDEVFRFVYKKNLWKMVLQVLYLHMVSGRPRVESPTSLVQHGTVHNV